MALNISGLVGNYIFGYIQDGMGRKPAYFIYLFIQCIFGIATAFSPNYIVWVVTRVGVGFTIPAILGTPCVLGRDQVKYFLFTIDTQYIFFSRRTSRPQRQNYCHHLNQHCLLHFVGGIINNCVGGTRLEMVSYSNHCAISSAVSYLVDPSGESQMVT